MLDMILIVVGKDLASVDEWHGSDLPCQVLTVANVFGQSLAKIGNRFLEISSKNVVGLVHADVSFGDGALGAFYDCAVSGAVCGIVGRDIGKGNRWSKYPFGYDDHKLPVASLGPGKVSTLDSCSVFLRKDLGLRFDEFTFDGLHCHVEDLCLQAHKVNIPVIVPHAIAEHRGDSTFNPVWQMHYRSYRTKLAVKWAGTQFETT